MPEKVNTDIFNELPLDLLLVLVFDPETGEFVLTEDANEEDRERFEAYKERQKRAG